MQTVDSEAALKSFSSSRDAYLDAMAKVPPDAFGYLKQGDDYSVGGIAVHVNFVLEHYQNVLNALIASGLAECRPEDPPGLGERAMARSGASLAAGEVRAELARTAELHDVVVETAGKLSGDWSRQAPVWYPGSTEVFPTSAADVLQWLIDHYQEHVPQIETLVSEWGEAPPSSDALGVVSKFNEAFGRADVDGVMAMMTDDCVFENTYPPPDGERHTGQAAVRAFWERFFSETETPRFETEDIFAAGDRVAVRWRFTWGDSGSGGHVRGVDVFRVRDGKVAEKLSYVKG
jgi:ketosteroid isomerase-like protein